MSSTFPTGRWWFEVLQERTGLQYPQKEADEAGEKDAEERTTRSKCG